MTEPILPPVEQRDLWRAIEEIQSALRRRQRTIIPVSVFLPCKFDGSGPTAAPTVASRGPGNLTGSYDWVYNYKDSGTGVETGLSGVLADVTLNESLDLAGARSTNPRHDLVQVFRSPSGQATYRLVGSVANPAAGNWALTANTQFLANAEVPMKFQWVIMTVCGIGWRLLKVKIKAHKTVSPSASAYWKFWVARQVEGRDLHEQVTHVEDTSFAGFSTAYPRLMKPRLTPGGVPTEEFDFLLGENDTLSLYAQGVGGVVALPDLTVTLSLVHEEG